MVRILGFLSLLLLAGPARAGDPSAQYARQVSTAQVRLAQLEALLVESELRIEQLEEVIRQQGRNEQNRLENLDQVNAEVSRLRGAIEVLQFEAGEMKRTVSDLQLESERRQLHAEMRLALVEKFLGLKAPPPPTDEELGYDAAADAEEGDSGPTPPSAPDRPMAGGDAEVPEGVPDDAAGKLDLAIEHMRADRQGVARAILRSALEQHPGAEETDEVRYRLAETYFNEEDYRTAISEFNKVVNNHPDSDWKCWSFYRMGESFELLGKPEGAQAFYKGATERECRSSEASRKAKDKL